MKIVKAELWHVQLPILKFTFRTSQGAVARRDTLILAITDDEGRIGYGEAVQLCGSLLHRRNLGR